MATQIQSTPELSGSAAERFNQLADEALKHRHAVNFSDHMEVMRKITDRYRLVSHRHVRDKYCRHT